MSLSSDSLSSDSLSSDPSGGRAARPAPDMEPRPAELAPADLDAPWQGLPIELRHVSHSFGPVVALDNISLSVPQGTLLGIVGPSGSGKTTTIRTWGWPC